MTTRKIISSVLFICCSCHLLAQQSQFYYQFEYNNDIGVVDSNGTEVVAPEYDDLKFLTRERWMLDNTKKAIVFNTQTGKHEAYTQYRPYAITVSDNHYSYAEKGDHIYLINEKDRSKIELGKDKKDIYQELVFTIVEKKISKSSLYEFAIFKNVTDAKPAITLTGERILFYFVKDAEYDKSGVNYYFVIVNKNSLSLYNHNLKLVQKIQSDATDPFTIEEDISKKMGKPMQSSTTAPLSGLSDITGGSRLSIKQKDQRNFLYLAINNGGSNEMKLFSTMADIRIERDKVYIEKDGDSLEFYINDKTGKMYCPKKYLNLLGLEF